MKECGQEASQVHTAWMIKAVADDADTGEADHGSTRLQVICCLRTP